MHSVAIPDGLITVEPQVRLSQAEAQTAWADVSGSPVLNARARLRLRPGRTCEPLARVLDRAIVRAEEAGFHPGSLVVVETSATAGDDLVRVRRNGYGSADWISSPTCSVRLVLGRAATDSPSAAGSESATASSDASPTSVHARAAGVDDLDNALSEVIDPDLGINIVDLGMVRAVVVENRAAVITLTLTSPACPLADVIERQLEERLAELSFIESFRVDWQWVPAWKPADITASGREQLRAIGFTI